MPYRPGHPGGRWSVDEHLAECWKRLDLWQRAVPRLSMGPPPPTHPTAHEQTKLPHHTTRDPTRVPFKDSKFLFHEQICSICADEFTHLQVLPCTHRICRTCLYKPAHTPIHPPNLDTTLPHELHCPLCTTSSACKTEWHRDLTEEGIEPHPGPPTPHPNAPDPAGPTSAPTHPTTHDQTCPICFEETAFLQDLPCTHRFCRPCLFKLSWTVLGQQQQNAYTATHPFNLDDPPPPELACPICKAPFTCQSEWLRDLTEEGIEPHPGPPTPNRIPSEPTHTAPDVPSTAPPPPTYFADDTITRIDPDTLLITYAPQPVESPSWPPLQNDPTFPPAHNPPLTEHPPWALSHDEWNSLMHALHGNTCPKKRFLSKNVNGWNTKLSNAMFRLTEAHSRAPILALAIQEHQITQIADRTLASVRTAADKGVLLIIS